MTVSTGWTVGSSQMRSSMKWPRVSAAPERRQPGVIVCDANFTLPLKDAVVCFIALVRYVEAGPDVRRPGTGA